MNCSVNSTSVKVLVAMASTGLLAVVTCVLGALLVAALRLYKVFTYRLALYQVLSGMTSGAVCVWDAAFVIYYRDHVEANKPMCLAVAFLLEYTMWAKLLFTLWTTFHLFAFSMCFKNFKTLEPFYICTALVFPALIAIVPFTTTSYGLAGQWCWIVSLSENHNCTSSPTQRGTVEQFALWFIPSSFVLAAESIAVVVMGIVLSYRAHRARRNEVIDRSYAKALKQMLPLIAYPITWCTLSVPTMADRLYQSIYSQSNSGLVMANAILTPGWNVAAGLALIVHILVLVLHRDRGQYSCCRGYCHRESNNAWVNAVHVDEEDDDGGDDGDDDDDR